jgi:DNA processing protein
MGVAERESYGSQIAYAYYQRALHLHAEGHAFKAVNDLEKAKNFPGLSERFRTLIQSRLTAIQKAGRLEEVRSLDEQVNAYFAGSISSAGVLGEFMSKYRLNKPHKALTIPHIADVSSISVYRWQGDQNYGETWTKLIRQAKKGERVVIALLSRLMAEHFKASQTCREWFKSIDFVVPVPSDKRRAAERGINVVETVARQFCDRVGLVLRTDFLSRTSGAEHSRNLARGALRDQYRFDDRKEGQAKGRTILLIDDVVTRGYTASICAERLKAAGASQIFLLTLAQAESTYQTQQHFGEALGQDAYDLAHWLCLAGTEKLGPVRIRALLDKFEEPSVVLKTSAANLRQAQDIGPKLADAIVQQAQSADQFVSRAATALDSARKLGAKVLTLKDAEYPKVLAGSGAGPAVLYFLGCPSVSNATKTIAIVGSRRPIDGARDLATRIAQDFAASGWVVVSGLAEGVDCLAHEACIKAGQQTLAVLGNGVDVVYPPSAKHLRQEIVRHGALISEYPFAARTSENQLRRRNRLIVGAARAVIVIQTKTDGGTMNSAAAARDLCRPLFCVEPLAGYEGEFSGNAELLRTGMARPLVADRPVTCVMSVLG